MAKPSREREPNTTPAIHTSVTSDTIDEPGPQRIMYVPRSIGEQDAGESSSAQDDVSLACPARTLPPMDEPEGYAHFRPSRSLKHSPLPRMVSLERRTVHSEDVRRQTGRYGIGTSCPSSGPNESRTEGGSPRRDCDYVLTYETIADSSLFKEVELMEETEDERACKANLLFKSPSLVTDLSSHSFEAPRSFSELDDMRFKYHLEPISPIYPAHQTSERKKPRETAPAQKEPMNMRVMPTHQFMPTDKVYVCPRLIDSANGAVIPHVAITDNPGPGTYFQDFIERDIVERRRINKPRPQKYVQKEPDGRERVMSLIGNRCLEANTNNVHMNSALRTYIANQKTTSVKVRNLNSYKNIYEEILSEEERKEHFRWGKRRKNTNTNEDLNTRNDGRTSKLILKSMENTRNISLGKDGKIRRNGLFYVHIAPDGTRSVRLKKDTIAQEQARKVGERPMISELCRKKRQKETRPVVVDVQRPKQTRRSKPPEKPMTPANIKTRVELIQSVLDSQTQCDYNTLKSAAYTLF